MREYLQLKLKKFKLRIQACLPQKVPNITYPKAKITKVNVKGVGFDGITLLVQVTVTNPYSVSIPICDIKYAVKCSNREIVTGLIPDHRSLNKKDITVFDVMVKVPHSALVSLARDIGPDWDIDYLLELGLSIVLPVVVRNFTINLFFKGKMKLPSVSDIIWGKSEEPKAVVKNR